MLGIFDSGIGGLTVVKELIKAVPKLSFVYFGDTARTPYGTKSPEVIQEYALEDTDFLLRQGARAVVVACNTVSSVAVDILRARHPGVPFFEVVTPAAVEALRMTKNGRVGVIGTRATVGSRIYERLLRSARNDVRVFSVPAPLLVPLVEEGWVKKPETKRILKQYLLPLKRAQIDTLILGCTHFPLLKHLAAPIMGKKVKLIDPAEALACEVAAYIKEHAEFISSKVTRRYVVSSRTPRFQEVAEAWLGGRVVLDLSTSGLSYQTQPLVV